MKDIFFDIKQHASYLPPSGKILVAPLNWGLGHATRCIPIIQQLLENGYDPIIASDGMAGDLLKLQFPTLPYFDLPSYNIKYPKNGRFFLLKMGWQLPHVFKTIKAEQKAILKIVREEGIATILSDNRFGVRHPDLPSIYITHQIRVKSGIFEKIVSRWHQKKIAQFDYCWVPDLAKNGMSGALSHNIWLKTPIRYIGFLSALNIPKLPEVIDVLILLSGPEPMREKLEHNLIQLFSNIRRKIVCVQGTLNPEKELQSTGNIQMYPFLKGVALSHMIAQSKIIIARSGYSSLMDLVPTGKKLILIPTPGQGEQIYLAKHLSHSTQINIVLQKDISIIPSVLQRLL